MIEQGKAAPTFILPGDSGEDLSLESSEEDRSSSPSTQGRPAAALLK
jgi:hypothetical protein